MKESLGHEFGWYTVLTDPQTGEILGVHAIGNRASETIHKHLLTRSSELLTDDIIRAVHGHPKLAEGWRDTVFASEGLTIHY